MDACPDSGRLPMVILEKSAQSLAAGDDTNLLTGFRPRLQHLVIQFLVCSFPMIMQQKFVCHVA